MAKDDSVVKEEAHESAEAIQENQDTDTRNAKGEELDAKSIHVKVYSPYQVYFDDDANSVSAENDTGPFDILPRHHNFMTLVNPCEVVIRRENKSDKLIRISRGVLHVRSNKVTLFLDV